MAIRVGTAGQQTLPRLVSREQTNAARSAAAASAGARTSSATFGALSRERMQKRQQRFQAKQNELDRIHREDLALAKMEHDRAMQESDQFARGTQQYASDLNKLAHIEAQNRGSGGGSGSGVTASGSVGGGGVLSEISGGVETPIDTQTGVPLDNAAIDIGAQDVNVPPPAQQQGASATPRVGMRNRYIANQPASVDPAMEAVLGPEAGSALSAIQQQQQQTQQQQQPQQPPQAGAASAGVPKRRIGPVGSAPQRSQLDIDTDDFFERFDTLPHVQEANAQYRQDVLPKFNDLARQMEEEVLKMPEVARIEEQYRGQVNNPEFRKALHAVPGYLDVVKKYQSQADQLGSQTGALKKWEQSVYGRPEVQSLVRQYGPEFRNKWKHFSQDGYATGAASGVSPNFYNRFRAPLHLGPDGVMRTDPARPGKQEVVRPIYDSSRGGFQGSMPKRHMQEFAQAISQIPESERPSDLPQDWALQNYQSQPQKYEWSSAYQKEQWGMKSAEGLEQSAQDTRQRLEKARRTAPPGQSEELGNLLGQLTAIERQRQDMSPGQFANGLSQWLNAADKVLPQGQGASLMSAGEWSNSGRFAEDYEKAYNQLTEELPDGATPTEAEVINRAYAIYKESSDAIQALERQQATTAPQPPADSRLDGARYMQQPTAPQQATAPQQTTAPQQAQNASTTERIVPGADANAPEWERGLKSQGWIGEYPRALYGGQYYPFPTIISEYDALPDGTSYVNLAGELRVKGKRKPPKPDKPPAGKSTLPTIQHGHRNF